MATAQGGQRIQIQQGTRGLAEAGRFKVAAEEEEAQHRRTGARRWPLADWRQGVCRLPRPPLPGLKRSNCAAGAASLTLENRPIKKTSQANSTENLWLELTAAAHGKGKGRGWLLLIQSLKGERFALPVSLLYVWIENVRYDRSICPVIKSNRRMVLRSL
jgi:hypothetical protein